MIKNFIICGLLGWCFEVIWTGFNSLIHGNIMLSSHTSLWMFPIYGMAVLLLPLYPHIRHLNFIIRGALYAICIFAVEFVTGMTLNLIHACPWNYSPLPTNVLGVIRLDYFPLWFITGLIFERILIVIQPQKSK